MSAGKQIYIGVDPGRTKCGIAGLYDDGTRAFVEVVPADRLEMRLENEIGSHEVAALCVGHATTSPLVVALCNRRWPSIPLHVVDETNTTFEARALFYEDHPPKGLLRFVPRGLLVPSAPLDGYAALLIVRRCRAALTAPEAQAAQTGKR